MLNAQIARARVADRNQRSASIAAHRQLLASSQPDKQQHRHQWRSHRIWNQPAERAPIQA